jgi:uncharacterized protein YbcI
VLDPSFARKVQDAYLAFIRSVGGRGPENIFVKIYGDVIHVNFTLARSPLENFILERFPDGREYLKDLNFRIHEIVKEDFLKYLETETGFYFVFSDFKMDLDTNKFQFSFIRKEK